MKVLLKFLATPAVLLLTLVVAFSTFVLMMASVLFWILAALVTIGAVLLFFSHQPAGGIAFLVIAFLVSPYGLPALTAWLVGKLDRAKYLLQDFIME